MAKFLYSAELYETVLQKSLETKEVLWASSRSLSIGAHRVFSQEILNNPPADLRFVFRMNDFAVKEDEVNPYEVQYILQHYKLFINGEI